MNSTNKRLKFNLVTMSRRLPSKHFHRLD